MCHVPVTVRWCGGRGDILWAIMSKVYIVVFGPQIVWLVSWMVSPISTGIASLSRSLGVSQPPPVLGRFLMLVIEVLGFVLWSLRYLWRSGHMGVVGSGCGWLRLVRVRPGGILGACPRPVQTASVMDVKIPGLVISAVLI